MRFCWDTPGTATLAERAKIFIDERFNSIAQGRTWKPFQAGPVCIAALVPIAGLAGRNSVDIAALNNSFNNFTLDDWHSVSRTMNLDGLVSYPAQDLTGRVFAYTQIYRNGAVVALRTAAPLMAGTLIIPSNNAFRICDGTLSKLAFA